MNVMSKAKLKVTEEIVTGTVGGGMTWHNVREILSQHLEEQNVICVNPKDEML